MGPGTEYTVTPDSNPFMTTNRSDQSMARPTSHGSISGSEWMNERVCPIRVFVDADDPSPMGWLSAHQALAAAFEPVGNTGEKVELRFSFGGSEFLLIGSPRMVDPDLNLVGIGRGFTQCAFVAPDPRIYSSALITATTGLTEFLSGLNTPFTVPFSIYTVLSSGLIALENAGRANSGLAVRIDGPVAGPQLVLQRPDGSVRSISFNLDLAAGQFLLVDSTRKTALLNGSASADYRGSAQWGWDTHPLSPGVTSLRFLGADDTGTTQVTASYRSAWW